MTEVKAKLTGITHKWIVDPANGPIEIHFVDAHSSAFCTDAYPKGTVIDDALIEQARERAVLGMTRWLQDHTEKPLNIRDLKTLTEKLVEALRKYGGHKRGPGWHPVCPEEWAECGYYSEYVDPEPCNCGFAKVETDFLK